MILRIRFNSQLGVRVLINALIAETSSLSCFLKLGLTPPILSSSLGQFVKYLVADMRVNSRGSLTISYNQALDLFLTCQLTMALHVETSLSPYQRFHRTLTIDLTASIVSCQSCIVYTMFVGNSVLSFTTSELNYSHDKGQRPVLFIAFQGDF